mmetsp:Transcript_30419/g.94196  ORF Transcript_30419/g.94196 Transcript_30419/m.94196 type:complete len:265 (+) Transcript_30419:339-1133(+)
MPPCSASSRPLTNSRYSFVASIAGAPDVWSAGAWSTYTEPSAADRRSSVARESGLSVAVLARRRLMVGPKLESCSNQRTKTASRMLPSLSAFTNGCDTVTRRHAGFARIFCVVRPPIADAARSREAFVDSALTSSASARVSTVASSKVEVARRCIIFHLAPTSGRPRSLAEALADEPRGREPCSLISFEAPLKTTHASPNRETVNDVSNTHLRQTRSKTSALTRRPRATRRGSAAPDPPGPPPRRRRARRRSRAAPRRRARPTR